MKVCIISFSGRKTGSCAAIGRYLRELHGEGAELFCFSDFTISPCGRCEQDCMAGRPCPYADDMELTLQEAVSGSDLAYFIVPNYSDYPCANFFAFSERSLSYVWGREERLQAYTQTKKKFIVVSNSPSPHFRESFSYHVEGEPELLLLGSKAFGEPILASEEAREWIRNFAIS